MVVDLSVEDKWREDERLLKEEKKMKKLFIMLFVLLFVFMSIAVAEMDGETNPAEKTDGGGECPITKVKGKIADCVTCHTLIKNDSKVVWGLKEIKPFSAFNPPNGAIFKVMDGETVGWYDFDYVEDSQVRTVIEYFYRHKTKKLIFNVDSFGGSAFDGYAIASVIGEYVGKIQIVTRIQTQAMSAGFLVFVAGHKRVVSPLATLMWHEISYWSFLKKITPTNSEQEAAVMRMLQDMANEYLASRSNLTKKKIDAEIANKDWFMSGKQAVEMGFADEFLMIPPLSVSSLASEMER